MIENSEKFIQKFGQDTYDAMLRGCTDIFKPRIASFVNHVGLLLKKDLQIPSHPQYAEVAEQLNEILHKQKTIDNKAAYIIFNYNGRNVTASITYPAIIINMFKEQNCVPRNITCTPELLQDMITEVETYCKVNPIIYIFNALNSAPFDLLNNKYTQTLITKAMSAYQELKLIAQAAAI